MTQKPTYKQLEQRVKELEKELLDHNRVEEALRYSETVLREVINTVPHAIYAYDRKGLHLLANCKAAELLGTTAEELTGALFGDIFHNEEQLNSFLADTGEVISKGQPKFIAEEPITDAEGNLRILQTIKIPFSWPAGGEQVVLGISTEITERKQAEEAVRKSEERFRSFLDNLGDVAYEADSNGIITYANKMAEEITQMPLEDFVGKHFLPLFTEESQKLAVEVFQRTLNGETLEYELTFTNGKIGHFKNEPLRDENQKIVGVFGIARDITARKRAQEALRQREAALEVRTNELEEVNRALRVLLKQRDEYKTEIEEKVMLNVKELVLPYIERLKRRRLGAKSMAYLSVLESNLNDIISSFAHELSSKHLGLTPAEIQIAHLIRDGRTTKEIAGLLNVSIRTIESHRQNIRMKLGLHGKKANLRSHLLSM